MVNYFDIIYFFLYSLCIVLSFVASRKDIYGLLYLRIMLVSGLVNELLGDWIAAKGFDKNITHYVYIPIEYLMLIAFYRNIFHDQKLLKNLLLLSGIFYLIMAYCIGNFYHHWKGFPSLVYLLCCILNAFWLPFLMMKIPLSIIGSNSFKPLIFIMSSLFIFYVGIFVFNTMYNYLLVRETAIAKFLRHLINYNLNYFLFVGLSCGFIISKKRVNMGLVLKCK